VIRQVKVPFIRAFWAEKYENYDDWFEREAIAPIQNAIGQFLLNSWCETFWARSKKIEILRCKRPSMIQKELMTYLLAHNLIRSLMAEAVTTFEADLQRVSFKGPVDSFRQYTAASAAARNKKMRHQLWMDLLLNLMRDKVPLRPGRQEPN
jgi:hypothetical protein